VTAALLYPFILVAGALQAIGNAMNAQLRGRMVNPWLAATVSFLPIVFVFTTLFLTMPTPLPSLDSLGKMPWYAPLGAWPVRWRCLAGSPSSTRSAPGRSTA
jgi:transporter family-2 protein